MNNQVKDKREDDLPNEHGVSQGDLDCPGLPAQLAVHLDSNSCGHGHQAHGLREHGGRHHLAVDRLLQAALLLT